MIRHPDNPQSASLAMLALLDKDPPGTWIAQPKLDGWRRTAWRLPDGSWQYSAKHTKGPAARYLPDELVETFESQCWPLEVALDMEWVGPRHKGSLDTLHVFDLLYLKTHGGFLQTMPFKDRYALLKSMMVPSPLKRGRELIHLVTIQANPGLLDYYSQQLTNPLSEGLVVRRADSGLVGSLTAPATNPRWFKFKHKEIAEK